MHWFPRASPYTSTGWLTRVRFSGTGGEPSKGGREAAQGSIAGATIDGKG